jgi:pimeloyl-ACP methyl ester carboxylesterase
MKQKTHIFLILLLLFIPFSLFSQGGKKTSAGIIYGNNTKSGKYLATRGIKLYYEIYGSGKPLLMIHGNGGSIVNFKNQIPYFEKHYKVIAVDSRAQGRSTDFGDSLNYEMMADDLDALLDALHVDSAYVIGWSDGGINGLLLSIRHPAKVKKLAITGANLIPDTSVIDPAGIAFITEARASILAAKQDENTRNVLKLLHMMEIEPNIPLSDLHKIKCPVLVIGGDHDVIRPGHTLQIFENIPQSYLWILPGAGHATLQRHAAEFNHHVQDFFAQPYQKTKPNDWDE